MLAVLFLSLLVIFLSVLILSSAKRKLPPGPKGKPFIGVLMELDNTKVHQQLNDWAYKYGTIFSFKVFGTVSVVISDEKLIRKVYSSSDFASIFNDRPDTFFGKYLAFDYSDIAFSMYGNATVKLRKALRKGLHFYGEGIKQFEDLMTKELRRLVKEISSYQGQEVDPRPIVENSMALLMSSLLLGREIKDNDNITARAIWEYLHVQNEILLPEVELTLFNIPALRFFPCYLRRMYMDVASKRDSVLKTFYLEQKRTYDPDKHRGLVDVILSLQHRNGEKHLTDEQVKGIIMDVLGGGMTTTTGAVLGLLLTLLNNEHCMLRIQDELESVPEGAGTAEYQEKIPTPYMKATILEALRLVPIVPLMPHCSKKDVEFEGYLIPAGAQIFANLWYIHHNPDIFPDPWTFKPERFLDESGQVIDAKHPNRMNLLAFSVGSRNCPGENLAKSCLHLYLSTLLKNFDIVMTSHTSADPNLYGGGIDLEPPSFKCKFITKFSQSITVPTDISNND